MDTAESLDRLQRVAHDRAPLRSPGYKKVPPSGTRREVSIRDYLKRKLTCRTLFRPSSRPRLWRTSVEKSPGAKFWPGLWPLSSSRDHSSNLFAPRILSTRNTLKWGHIPLVPFSSLDRMNSTAAPLLARAPSRLWGAVARLHCHVRGRLGPFISHERIRARGAATGMAGYAIVVQLNPPERQRPLRLSMHCHHPARTRTLPNHFITNHSASTMNLPIASLRLKAVF